MEANIVARSRQYSILFVDDEQSILKAIERVTFESEANCLFFNSPLQALDYIRENPVDILVSDINMPEMSGIELLAQVAEEYPEIIRMALSGMSEKDTVLDAINQGRIWGFITKPWDNDQLLNSLEQAVYLRSLILERLMLQRSVSQLSCLNQEQFDDFIGDSLAMQCVYQLISKAAPSEASVFVTGESGTGKELVAAALHKHSKRKDKPFVTLNCAAIPSELLESEIFGHAKGAFSGAHKEHEGLASKADGGTFFLDEISEMDMSLQSKLLRFIQTGRYSKVGSSQEETVNIRFVSACNRDPLAAIESGTLREDLYYRLNVIAVDMPALREREWDALLLANHFLQLFAQKEDKLIIGFDEKSEALISNYHWPGNVRQLENAVYSAVILSSEQLINSTELNNSLKLSADQLAQLIKPKKIRSKSYSTAFENAKTLAVSQVQGEAGEAVMEQAASQQHGYVADSSAVPCPIPLSQVERKAVEDAIKFCDQNVAKAAAMLEVSPSTLYRKMQQWQD
ncbi:MAG: sigma-54 dependent transcriptional regulator [Cellvibrionaceae bacterium]|nr:sigma-54 dependent transcriptional regulator [Cellvibrionaceae bacterium]